MKLIIYAGAITTGICVLLSGIAANMTLALLIILTHMPQMISFVVTGA